MTQEVEQLLLPAPLGRGRARGHRRGPQPDQRRWACARGSKMLHVSPRADPGMRDISKRVLGAWLRLLVCSSLAKAGRPQSLQMGLAGPGLPSWLPEWGERTLGREGVPGIWSAVGAHGPQPPCPPIPRTPREGEVRTITRVSFYLWAFSPPGKSNSEAVFQVFAFVLSVPS